MSPDPGAAPRKTVDRLAVLMYHSLDDSGSVVSLPVATFEAQMASLADAGYRGITLAEAVAWRRRFGGWPAGAVAITFDDGYASVHEHAWPILARVGFSATIFLVTDHVGRNNDWAPPPAGLGVRPLFGWEAACELARAGIEIGAHTKRHPDLCRLGAEERAVEIEGSRRDIEQRLGIEVDSFAYPYGRLDAGSVEIAARCYRAACTTRLERAGPEPDALISRVDTYYYRATASLVSLVEGRQDGRLTLRRAARGLRRLAGRLSFGR